MSPAAKIGLFMLLGLIILGVFIIKIEDIPVGERGDRLEVTARFESVAGLDRQAAVRIAGVRIGKVEDISLDGSKAVLLLSLQPSVRLHEGAWLFELLDDDYEPVDTRKVDLAEAGAVTVEFRRP